MKENNVDVDITPLRRRLDKLKREVIIYLYLSYIY